MKKGNLTGLLLLGIYILIFHAIAEAQSRSENVNGHANTGFRYVIVEDRIDRDSATRESCRVVEVLLDENAYSEATLRKLFARLSKRFSIDEVLDVTVYTSLEDVPTPEEREAGTSSGRSEQKKGPYYRAVYLRSVDDEYFRYVPLGNKTGIKTVQIRKVGK